MKVTMINGYILIKPLEVKAVQTELKAGYASFKNKTSFQVIEVVYGTEEIKSGCKILLRADCFNQPWAKNKYYYNEQELLMIPVNEVLGIVE